ncbi:hypothetical protein [Mycolicibacterium diernhoferi]|nr:hypothetical protein [Mycolicibacterium diernhoferi]QYL21314.1 hypothetical protein K0O62_20110 [Mycolicibacterium diernhoferi]
MIPPYIEGAIREAKRRNDGGSEFGVSSGLRPRPRPHTFEHTPARR